MVSWYRRYIPRFADTAEPLHRLLQKRRGWNWTEIEDQAFETLRKQLSQAPVLACPDFGRIFTLQTDASKNGLGVVLTQEIEGEERVIAYASRTLNGAERNCSVTEQECLAVVWGIRKMRPYLEGYHFIVITDHQALQWLRKLENPSGRLARWGLELQQYDFYIQYRRGEQNLVADALSRQPQELGLLELPQDAWYEKTVKKVENNPEEHPGYKIYEGQLYRHIPDHTGLQTEREWKRCVPAAERKSILQLMHDDPTAGHLGTAKTIHRLFQRFYWTRMRQETAKYGRKCHSCLQFKALQQAPAGKMFTTVAMGPWDIATIDLVGPLPRTSQGYTTIAVMQDKF